MSVTLPENIIEQFRKSNYCTAELLKGHGEHCRTELEYTYDKGGHDHYPESLMYNVLQYRDGTGRRKKADRHFAEFAGEDEAKLFKMFIDWMQETFD